jgi:AcrR family transcriptional regulator
VVAVAQGELLATLSPTQAERSEATRAALIAAARELFAQRGYTAVSTTEIVDRARVTRGALYHHFKDKRALFAAVHQELEAELVTRIGEGLAGDLAPSGAFDLLVAGTDRFLDACEEPTFARISLQEAPSVLGWQRWREIDAQYSMGLITGVLEHGMQAGELREQPIEPLAHLLLGALGEAGLLIASGVPRAHVRAPLLALLTGLLAERCAAPTDHPRDIRRRRAPRR